MRWATASRVQTLLAERRCIPSYVVLYLTLVTSLSVALLMTSLRLHPVCGDILGLSAPPIQERSARQTPKGIKELAAASVEGGERLRLSCNVSIRSVYDTLGLRASNLAG